MTESMISRVLPLLLLVLLGSCASEPRSKEAPVVPFSLEVKPTGARFVSWSEAVLRLRFKNHTTADISLPLGHGGGGRIVNFDSLRFSAESNGDVYQAVFKIHALRRSVPMVAVVGTNGTSAEIQIPLSLLVWRHDPKLKYETPDGKPYPTGTQWFDREVAELIVPPAGVYSCKLGYVPGASAFSQDRPPVWSNAVTLEIKTGGGEQSLPADGEDTAAEG